MKQTHAFSESSACCQCIDSRADGEDAERARGRRELSNDCCRRFERLDCCTKATLNECEGRTLKGCLNPFDFYPNLNSTSNYLDERSTAATCRHCCCCRQPGNGQPSAFPRIQATARCMQIAIACRGIEQLPASCMLMRLEEKRFLFQTLLMICFADLIVALLPDL